MRKSHIVPRLLPTQRADLATNEMASNSVLETDVEQGVDATLPDASQHVQSAGRSAAAMAELRRVQLANEGMRLLLTSEVRKAEELFKSSR